MAISLSSLVNEATHIHVTSHLNPDYDAYASMLFMYALLKKNFIEKSVSMSLETVQPNEIVSYLPHFSEIAFGTLEQELKKSNTDLLVIVDSATLNRVTTDTLFIKEHRQSIKIALFDHHEIEETDFDLLESHQRYATVEVIYQYANENSLALPDKWEEYYLTGFIGDSYRFYYQYPDYHKSFETIATILDHGYTVREYSDRLYGYSQDDLTIFRLLFSHLNFRDSYIFSYITWEDFCREIEGKISQAAYKKARRYFIDEIMVKTYGFDFAVFIVPDDVYNDGKTFNGSIRSKSRETLDCTVIAKQLNNGGGHATGAGFTVIAENIDDACKQVFETVEKFEIQARETARHSKL